MVISAVIFSPLVSACVRLGREETLQSNSLESWAGEKEGGEPTEREGPGRESTTAGGGGRDSERRAGRERYLSTTHRERVGVEEGWGGRSSLLLLC